MRTKHPRLRLLAVFLALSAMLAAVGPAQAAGPRPVRIDLLDCLFTGAATVPARTPIVLTIGWSALTLRLEAQFLHSQRTEASINGVPIRHPDRYWQDPQKTYPFPDLPWLMSWDYPVKALKPGHSITAAYEWFLRVPVTDGVDTYPRGPVLGPFGAFPSCVITAR